MLQGLDQKGSRLTKAMTERQEYLDRFKKFERAIKTLTPDDRQVLVNLLKTKLETACRSIASVPLSASLAFFPFLLDESFLVLRSLVRYSHFFSCC